MTTLRRWRRYPLASLPLVAVVAVLTGCSAPADALSVPTDRSISDSTDGDFGSLQGELQGERMSDGRACFWVDGPNGRAFLVMREGSYATKDLELHPRGVQEDTLRVGETYLFAGAANYDLKVDGCSGAGAAWYTPQVLPANANYRNATLAPPKPSSTS